MRTLASPRRVALGPLRAIEFAAPEGSPSIVCFHGYGADAADLAPLAGELDVPGPARWLFPDGPLPIPAFPAGRAWFPIDEERLARIQLGQAYDLSGVRPAGLDEAIEKAEAFLEASGAPWPSVVLGGFSQGAMLALALALRAPEPPKGLFLLSATLVDEANVRRLAPSKAGLKVFQSHGEDDNLLPYAAAGRLRDILVGSGWNVAFAAFPGGHSIPREAAEGLQAYLGEALTEPQSR